MNPIADLRAAVLSLNQVPDSTPVEPSFAYGSPSMLSYDANAGVVHLSVGGGRPNGRPTMGQLRTWLGLPSIVAAPAPALAGVWDSLKAQEPATIRGVLTFVSAAASGYHGARRNGGSIFWGLIWFAAGAALPGLFPIVAVAQGYGSCVNNCRRGSTYKD